MQKVTLHVKRLVVFDSTINRGFEEKVRNSLPAMFRCSSEALATVNTFCDRFCCDGILFEHSFTFKYLKIEKE
jgi:hypothetical protein